MPASVRSPASAAVDAGNINVSKPSGAVDGDLLLAVCFADPDGAAVTAPAGWTLVGSAFAPAGIGFGRVYRKAASGEPASYTFTGSAGSSNNVIVLAVTGHDSATPIDVAATWGSGAASASHIAPSVSPTGSDSLLVCGWYGLTTGAASTYTPPGTMTERADLQPPGLWIVSSVATEGLTASGATGTRTATLTFSRPYIGVSVAVKSAGGGTTVNGTASLPAAATFTANPTVVTPGTGALTGTGTVTAAGTIRVTATAFLTGAGTLTASSGGAVLGTAGLIGAGTVAATPTVVVPAAASLPASGTLTATGAVRLFGAATLTGAGALTGASGAAVNGAAALTAGGTIAGAAVVGKAGTAALSGSGTLTAPATVRVFGDAVLVGAGSLTAVGGGRVFASATLAGSGVFSAAGTASGQLVTRPNTGTVTRPASGLVSRPTSGLVARTTSGFVTRPDTGVVSRP